MPQVVRDTKVDGDAIDWQNNRNLSVCVHKTRPTWGQAFRPPAFWPAFFCLVLAACPATGVALKY